MVNEEQFIYHLIKPDAEREKLIKRLLGISRIYGGSIGLDLAAAAYAVERYPECYQKWISVNERLPGIRKSIIFATKSGYATEGEYIGDCWVQYRWTTKVKNEEVTHWMPLPEPPKENVNDK